MIKNKQPILLDGAVGTELERRGYKTKLPLWSATAIKEAPELLVQIHKDYVLAGADIITANTFRTTIYTYQKFGLTTQQAIDDTARALEIAQESVKQYKDKSVAASLTTLEDCYKPERTPELSILKEFHGMQIDAIRSAGCELVLAETMHTIREAKVIAKYCHDNRLPYMLSFISGEVGKLLGGDLLVDAIETISKYNPQAILINCRPWDNLIGQLKFLKNFSGKIGMYANGSGALDDQLGWVSPEKAEHQFLEGAIQCLEVGVDIIGGCCGTRPEDIREVREYLETR